MVLSALAIRDLGVGRVSGQGRSSLSSPEAGEGAMYTAAGGHRRCKGPEVRVCMVFEEQEEAGGREAEKRRGNSRDEGRFPFRQILSGPVGLRISLWKRQELFQGVGQRSHTVCSTLGRTTLAAVLSRDGKGCRGGSWENRWDRKPDYCNNPDESAEA